MTSAALFTMLFLFMFLGMPVAVALGLSSVATILFFSGDSLSSVALKLFEALSEHYTLLAIPFFILSSAFLSTGGVARRLITFAVNLVGHIRGGLAMASVMACMMFAAVSGSSPATVAAIGTIVIAGMVRSGYPEKFAAGVIANAGTHELRFFDRSGSFIRSVGGQGEGPGEFTALGSIALRGDSLVAYDRRSLRFTVFDRDGEYVGTTPPGDTFVGLLADGTLISYRVTTSGMPDPGTVTRSRGLLLRHAPGGTEPDTIVRFAMNDRYVHTEIPGFSERVIFRELFLNGLTLLDLKEGGAIKLTLSHVAARQEMRDMVKALELPQSGQND
jgi:hypothetical protein